ncbi:MAG: lysylphosphatidylglycerol synthase transmembrane domain-containing protein [Hyphomicrobiales bacterium]
MTRSRLWLTALGLGLSAIAVVALLRSIDASDAARHLATTRWGWFTAASLATVAAYAFRSQRWGEILSPHGRPPAGRLFSATMIGFLAINTLPARIGELVRAYTLARTERIPTATVLGSVAVERILDLGALGIFWSLSLLFAPYPEWFRMSGYVTLLLGVVILGTLWALHRFAGISWAEEEGMLLRWLPPRPRRALATAIPAFALGLRALQRPRVLVRAALGSGGVWFAQGIVFLFVAWSLGMKIPLWSPLLLAFVVSIGIMVPSSPGFVGVLEGACVVGLGLLGVGGAEGLAFGILYHASQLLPLAVLGTWFAARTRVGPEVLGGQEQG